MTFPLIIPDDRPAMTGMDVGGLFSLRVHITNSNILAPTRDAAVPEPTTNRVLFARAGKFSVGDYSTWPTISSRSPEFKQLADNVGAHNIIVEFANSLIPSEPWRYQIYSRGPMCGHAVVTDVEIYPPLRLAVLTYRGSLHGDVSGYTLGVIVPEKPAVEVSLARRTNNPVAPGKDVPDWVTIRDSSLPSRAIINKKDYPKIVSEGFSSWRFKGLGLDRGSSRTRATNRSSLASSVFAVSPQIATFDDTKPSKKYYGKEHRPYGRSPNHGSVVFREGFIKKLKSASGYTYEMLAGAVAQTDDSGKPYIKNVNKDYADGTSSTTSFMTGGDISGFIQDTISLIPLIVSSEGGLFPICGGDSLDKVLPAVLRSFGSSLSVMHGAPVTRTVDNIDVSAQEKTPHGYLVGTIRVESTLSFPKDLQFGPYTVWIDGHKFEYSQATSGCTALLVDLVSKDFLLDRIGKNAEVVLDVPSLPPDVIGLF